ncbi:zinc transporter ZIP13 homolog isoform X2 [Halyomorpha halys]|uniref:zinc transporter ZIP13 homolog isoform X2 n=1 Tax=Halyomorpha halys TaxID=286706 RepID=UPI0034D2127A
MSQRLRHTLFCILVLWKNCCLSTIKVRRSLSSFYDLTKFWIIPNHLHPPLFSGLWVLTGLLVFIIVEKLFQKERPSEVEEPTNNNEPKGKSSPKEIGGYLNLMANVIDNFTHGLAVGGSFLLSLRIGLLTTAAILIHEVPHEVGDFAILLKSGFSRLEAAKAQLMTASSSLIGAMTAVAFSGSNDLIKQKTSWILPFTAGGFLHIALVSVLPELIEETSPRESLKQLLSLLLGISVMAALTMIVEE